MFGAFFESGEQRVCSQVVPVLDDDDVRRQVVVVLVSVRIFVFRKSNNETADQTINLLES